MKKNAQKLVILALALSLLLGLAACGGGGGTASTSPTPENSQEQETPAASTPTGDPTEVVFWHSYGGATGEAMQSMIDEFNSTVGKEQNIFCNLIYQGYEGTDKVILAYQTKDTANAPDVNVGLTSTIPSMKDLSWTVPVETYLNRSDATVSTADFYAPLLRAVTYEDEIVSIPFSNSMPMLYYNVEALADAGFDRAPETWDELIAYTEALTERDASGSVTRYGLNMQVKRYQLVSFVVSQSENSFFGDQEGGRAAPMTKIVAGEDGTLRSFLEKLDALNQTGGYKWTEDSINEEFAQGMHAMLIMSSSRMGTLDNLVTDFTYMAAPIPKVNSDDTSGAPVGGSCLTLFNRGNDARVDAAWEVIQYCVSPENQAMFAKASGYLPVNVASENTADMQDFYAENPQYMATLNQLKSTNANAQEPLDPTYNEINSIITNVMLEFCGGQLTVDQTIDKIVSECNASLDEYYEANG